MVSKNEGSACCIWLYLINTESANFSSFYIFINTIAFKTGPSLTNTEDVRFNTGFVMLQTSDNKMHSQRDFSVFTVGYGVVLVHVAM